MSQDIPSILQFIGRLHVMLVHLPIGALVLLAALEILGGHSRLKHATASNGVIFGLTVPIVTFSAACGWVLAWCNDGYDTQILFWHRWTGTALVPLSVLLWWLHWHKHLRAYRVSLGASVILLVVAGHFGATLTHGSDYLFPKATVRSAPAGTYAELMELPVYTAIVHPIMAESCVSCHGPSKSKAGLKLDTADNIFIGGDDGAVVAAGDSGHSELLRRILMPLESDEHMPPQGKHQPSFNDVTLLKWWIDSGASTNKTIAQLSPPANIVQILQSRGQSK